MANKYYVIDTNVFIAAKGGATHLSDKEVDKCNLFVGSLFNNTIISLDTQGEIFTEYLRYLSLSGQPSISDIYFKFLYDHQYNTDFCELVDIEKNKHGIYKQLGDKKDLLVLDPNDLKFVAVYLGSKKQVKICNASDSDWDIKKELLSIYKIKVHEILQGES
jgi:hypothetical protein